jgi:hypothetical protein
VVTTETEVNSQPVPALQYSAMEASSADATVGAIAPGRMAPSTTGLE